MGWGGVGAMKLRIEGPVVHYCTTCCVEESLVGLRVSHPGGLTACFFFGDVRENLRPGDGTRTVQFFELVALMQRAVYKVGASVPRPSTTGAPMAQAIFAATSGRQGIFHAKNRITTFFVRFVPSVPASDFEFEL